MTDDDSNSEYESSDSDDDLSFNLITPTFRTRFYDSIYRQNFSFHNTLMYYITHNPSTPEVYQKLIKTCKYFFYKNPIVFIPYLYFGWTNYGWNIIDRIALKDISCKVWLTVKINISINTERDWISNLIPKLYQSNIKKFNLWSQDISLKDLIFVAARKCKKLCFASVTVTDGEAIVVLEKIIEVLPKLRYFAYYLSDTPPICISEKTVENLLKIPHFFKFTHLYLNGIFDNFDEKEKRGLILFKIQHKNVFSVF